MPFRIDSIVAASDLSDNSSEVIRSAAALAALTGANLHVMHAEDEGTSIDAQAAPPREPSPEITKALRDQVAESVPRSVEVASRHVDVGHAPTAILMRAAEVEAELIVIGAHRERAGAVLPLGTTADQVVRASPRPCLVVRGPIDLPLRQILVPTDLSRAAEVALEVALTWATALRMPTASGQTTGMDILHVITPSEGEAEDPAGSARDHIDRQLARIFQRAGARPRLDIRVLVLREDDPAQAILRLASESSADLLVMATHSSEDGGKQMGSVSSTVARHSPAPVLLVPPVLWRTLRAHEAAMNAT